MKSVNSDLTFTMELCQDFNDGRIPTLSFSLWSGEANEKPNTGYGKDSDG